MFLINFSIHPEVFDDRLPEITLSDVDVLRKSFPDLVNLSWLNNWVNVQVSLAIHGGYVTEKFQTANNKTGILGPN